MNAVQNYKDLTIVFYSGIYGLVQVELPAKIILMG